MSLFRHPALAAIDWRTVFLSLPRRRFTPAELARAVPEPMSPTVRLSVALNLALPTAAILWVFGRDGPWVVPAVTVVLVALLSWLGLRAWANPSARVPRLGYWLMPLACGLVFGWLLKGQQLAREATAALAVLMISGSFGLWFVIVYRHQYVQMRLAEMDERDRALEMARRLTAAQLEPHFLFNTLASLQHWVATRDDRATPLLEALTGYLRATLPMFSRPTLTLADETEVVRRYLQVMQARLGDRLAWRLHVAPELATLELPPGIVLTLVENAVVHGIEPTLHGGQVSVSAVRLGDAAVVVVEDDGAGLAPDAADGLGLRNCRERLALTRGATAALSLGPRGAGGCRAELRLPWPPDPAHRGAATRAAATDSAAAGGAAGVPAHE
ncbi:MAG: histidine kinase [Rubrivivax sp.]|nr:histidine kinase [Rubrivivax sp.]